MVFSMSDANSTFGENGGKVDDVEVVVDSGIVSTAVVDDDFVAGNDVEYFEVFVASVVERIVDAVVVVVGEIIVVVGGDSSNEILSNDVDVAGVGIVAVVLTGRLPVDDTGDDSSVETMSGDAVTVELSWLIEVVKFSSSAGDVDIVEFSPIVSNVVIVELSCTFEVDAVKFSSGSPETSSAIVVTNSVAVDISVVGVVVVVKLLSDNDTDGDSNNSYVKIAKSMVSTSTPSSSIPSKTDLQNSSRYFSFSF
mmetsp:Transcript_28690/g.60861  ORF Transcript_28690/g.60861 Transcript_28690/m.60861 type:complete len:252 (-) Transcript_28690:559-1314(-)